MSGYHRARDSDVSETESARRLALAVIGQAVADTKKGVAMGVRSSAWTTVQNAVRFLLIELWHESCVWRDMAGELPAQARIVAVVRAQVGLPMLRQVVGSLGMPAQRRVELLAQIEGGR